MKKKLIFIGCVLAGSTMVSMDRYSLDMRYKPAIWQEAYASACCFLSSIASNSCDQRLHFIQAKILLILLKKQDIARGLYDQIVMYHNHTPIKELFCMEYELEIFARERKKLLAASAKI